MAIYVAPNGKDVEAIRLDEDRVVDNVGTIGKKGEWLLYVEGRPNLAVDAAFITQFRQKYPRAVDAEPEPLAQGGKVA